MMAGLYEKDDKITTYINGSRRLSNIFWALAISFGGLGFFLTGLSSYVKTNLLLFSDVNEVLLIPQGIVLLFYGTAGIVLGVFLCLTVWWDIGFGYNEYNILLIRPGNPTYIRTRDTELLFLRRNISTML